MNPPTTAAPQEAAAAQGTEFPVSLGHEAAPGAEPSPKCMKSGIWHRTWLFGAIIALVTKNRNKTVMGQQTVLKP